MLRKWEFTLIELLVVIAIISILASILLPVLKKAVESGIKASCASRLKQISTGIFCYVNDYNGYLPLGRYFDESGDPVGWSCIMMDYMDMNKMVCPKYYANYTFGGGFGKIKVAYGMPDGGTGGLNHWKTGTKLQQLKQPSDTIGVFDWGSWQYWITAAQRPDPSEGFRTKPQFYRHNNTANFLFGDGSLRSSNNIDNEWFKLDKSRPNE